MSISARGLLKEPMGTTLSRQIVSQRSRMSVHPLVIRVCLLLARVYLPIGLLRCRFPPVPPRDPLWEVIFRLYRIHPIVRLRYRQSLLFLVRCMLIPMLAVDLSIGVLTI